MAPRDLGPIEPLLRELFPFRLIVDPGPPATIVGAGPVLTRWLGDELIGRTFEERFAIERPSGTGLSLDDIRAKHSSVFIVAARRGQRKLRGQMVVWDDRILFLGSPMLSTEAELDGLGLAMTDFAPHDATLDMVVLQRFAQMQVEDLALRSAELRRAEMAQAVLNEEAMTDPLTSLPNRRAFWESCQAALDAGRRIGLLFIDVDRFKSINDRFGHGAGDAVLRALAERLHGGVRDGDLVARLGGDEFVVLLLDADDDTVGLVVDRLGAAAAEPIDVDTVSLTTTISIGVVAADGDNTVDELLQNADAAMYEGRSRDRGTATWFADRMRLERNDRRELTNHLERAVTEGEITAAFQPIVSLDDWSVTGCEALARWHHPTRGQIPPDAFIELAELSGLVADLDNLMLRLALAEVRRWHELVPDLSVQVNVSGRSVRPDLAERVATALDEADVEPGHLVVEVTESWLLRDEPEVAAAFNAIADLGAHVHLDDFGTGYSSLAHIHALPISGLKVDRSFVNRLSTSERSRRLIAATIGLARSLDLEVTAEGVETEDQAELLDELGCDVAQGYFFGRPMPAEEFRALLEDPPVRNRPGC
ncbi:MAG: EAL domain-containing protein [Actinomycetota bacterium]